jgi:hypothetical protein
MQVCIPSTTEHTSVRRGYDHRLDTPSASTRGRFAQWALAGGRGVICRPKKVTRQGEVLGERRMGQDYLPLLLIFILFIISRGLQLRRGSPPPLCICGSPGNAFEPFFLFSRTLPFIFGAVGLPPCHILGQGDPPQVTAHTSKTLQHERSRRQKRQKTTQSSRNKPKRTQPGAADPVPHGNRARTGVPVYPESKDHPDPGINIRIR